MQRSAEHVAVDDLAQSDNSKDMAESQIFQVGEEVTYLPLATLNTAAAVPIQAYAGLGGRS